MQNSLLRDKEQPALQGVPFFNSRILKPNIYFDNDLVINVSQESQMLCINLTYPKAGIRFLCGEGLVPIFPRYC